MAESIQFEKFCVSSVNPSHNLLHLLLQTIVNQKSNVLNRSSLLFHKIIDCIVNTIGLLFYLMDGLPFLPLFGQLFQRWIGMFKKHFIGCIEPWFVVIFFCDIWLRYSQKLNNKSIYSIPIIQNINKNKLSTNLIKFPIGITNGKSDTDHPILRADPDTGHRASVFLLYLNQRADWNVKEGQ